MRKLFTILIASSLLFACNKEESVVAPVSDSENEYVPFFELAKGEEIAKNIYREKPEFVDSDEVTILYNSECSLKGAGIASNPKGYPLTWFNIRIKSKSGVPSGYIPIDLNEGAGGKWIYLKPTFSSTIKTGYGRLSIKEHSARKFSRYHGYLEYITKDGSNQPADLNDGAGGKYLYLALDKRYDSESAPIRQIGVASSKSSTIQFNGWKRVNKDLNKGAGGKYIYIFYKK